MGIYDNEAGCYLEDDETYGNGALWLTLDTESGIEASEDYGGFFWIVPQGQADIEGPDGIRFSNGPNEGRYISDVIAQACRAQTNPNGSPKEWDVDWAKMGLTTIPDFLKRLDAESGYYHA